MNIIIINNLLHIYDVDDANFSLILVQFCAIMLLLIIMIIIIKLLLLLERQNYNHRWLRQHVSIIIIVASLSTILMLFNTIMHLLSSP